MGTLKSIADAIKTALANLFKPDANRESKKK